MLKEVLKSTGWTVPASSDGTTYNAAGDEITTGGSGAGGLANNRAWFRIQDPDGGREFTFQRVNATTNGQWRVKYSALDRFTGGSPAATVTPSATDEAVLFGAGTDASPTTSTALFNTDGNIGRWHIITWDEANARGVWPFFAFATDPGSSPCDTLIMCESMDPDTVPALVGTRASPTTGDPDPCIVQAAYNGSSGAFRFGSNTAGWTHGTTGPRAWFGMNGTNGLTEAFVSMFAADYGVSSSQFSVLQGAAGAGVNPYDSADEALPLWIGRSAGAGSQQGLKGACEHVRACCVLRSYPSTVNLASGAYVYVEDALVPWEDGTTPLT
jgi:hypothetical protein